MRLTFQVQRQNINSKHNNLHSILENNKSIGKEKKKWKERKEMKNSRGKMLRVTTIDIGKAIGKVDFCV